MLYLCQHFATAAIKREGLTRQTAVTFVISSSWYLIMADLLGKRKLPALSPLESVHGSEEEEEEESERENLNSEGSNKSDLNSSSFLESSQPSSSTPVKRIKRRPSISQKDMTQVRRRSQCFDCVSEDMFKGWRQGENIYQRRLAVAESIDLVRVLLEQNSNNKYFAEVAAAYENRWMAPLNGFADFWTRNSAAGMNPNR